MRRRDRRDRGPAPPSPDGSPSGPPLTHTYTPARTSGLPCTSPPSARAPFPLSIMLDTDMSPHPALGVSSGVGRLSRALDLALSLATRAWARKARKAFSIELVRDERLELVDVCREAPQADLLDLGRVDQVGVGRRPLLGHGRELARRRLRRGVGQDVERACIGREPSSSRGGVRRKSGQG